MTIKLKLNKLSGVGKNNFGVTRKGIHYPKSGFVKFRNECLSQIYSQKPLKSFLSPVCMRIWYNPPDKRKRDSTAILDALFHILEKAGILKDDSLVEKIDYQKLNGNYNFTFFIEINEISNEYEI